MLPNEKEKRPIGLTALSALEREAVNCFKGFALPVEAKAKPLKTLKLAISELCEGKG